MERSGKSELQQLHGHIQPAHSITLGHGILTDRLPLFRIVSKHRDGVLGGRQQPGDVLVQLVHDLRYGLVVWSGSVRVCLAESA